MPIFNLGHPGRCVCSAARQPIVDADTALAGYELLCRPGKVNRFLPMDGDLASRVVMELALRLGTSRICGGLPAFLNCTRETLLAGLVLEFSPAEVVVEILENVPADRETRRACESLKAVGYRIALDDFVADDPRLPLCDLADFLKVDIRQNSPEEAAQIARRFRNGSCAVLAEKVELEAEFLSLRDAGFEFFQGYHFGRPQRIEALQSPDGAEESSSEDDAWCRPENLEELTRLLGEWARRTETANTRVHEVH